MADVTQNVIIEFITDDSQLKPSVDLLEKMGKVDAVAANSFKATNAEMVKQANVVKMTAEEFRKSGLTLEQLAAQVKKSGAEFTTLAALEQKLVAVEKTLNAEIAKLTASLKGESSEVAKLKEQLKATNDAFDKLKNSKKQTGDQAVTLKSQLRVLVEQMAQMKLAGQSNTQQFQDLSVKAGKLKDAIGDANQEVKNFASDTSTFDGLLSLTSGLAGGFAVAQGATALFGDESEELQKTLLRVNAAMAILQGLQQIQIVLQKESAASQFANTIATKVQTAALTAYNFVVGTSTGLMKFFRIALAATGIGLLVIGVLALVDAFKSSNNEMEETNELIESQARLLERLNQVIQRQTDIQEARLRAANAAESELIKNQGRSLVRQIENTIRINQNLRKQQDELNKTSEAWFELTKKIEENVNVIDSLNTQVNITKIQLEKQLADEQAEAAKKRKDEAKQAAEDAKKAREDQLQKEKEARAQGFADNKAFVELQLLAVQKGSEEELRIKKELLRAELQQALDNDKLTENQRKLLVKKFFSERLDLEKQFAKDRDKIILENIGSDIQAELQGLQLSNEKKLELTETAIQIQAQLEIDAANNNAAKIAEINAKRDKAIRDARIASIQEVVNYEISLAEAANGPGKRRLQAVIASSEAEANARRAAVDEIAAIDSGAIQKKIDALNTEKQQKLISEKDYQIQYTQLVDQQVVIWEEAEKKKTEITNTESEKRIDQIKKDIENVVMVASAVSDVLSGIADIQTQIENEKLSKDRAKIKELQDAGAITEKEAVARLKRLDIEERNIKRRQAQRDKALALFNAVISTAKGIAAAIPNPFLIALAAVIGAAQIALIAARPIPQFSKGKKGRYEGLAEVGEAGSELVEHKGRMFIAEKPKVIWLGKTDKVYSHKETIEMMSKPGMSRERNGVIIKNDKGITIDYDKIGKAVADNVQTNVFVDGVQEQAIKRKEFIKYLDNKRNF